MTRKTQLHPALQQETPPNLSSDWTTNAGLVEIQIEYRAVAELILDARNPRQHSERQINQLADSIREFGFVVPAATDGEGRVVIGHGRVLAAKKLKMARIPVIEIKHLSRAQLKALRIADNKLGQNSHWDERLLAESLLELKELDDEFDLSITGFSLPEIDLAIQKLSEPVVEDIDGADSRTGIPVCELGDVWKLGTHRVLCGDATSQTAFEHLMGEGRADVVFVDPPYNVRIDGHVSGKGKVRHREFAQGSGELNRDEFVRFLASNCALLKSYSRDGAIHFVCMDWAHLDELLTAGRDVYTELKNIAVWVKSTAGMGSLYRSQHELICWSARTEPLQLSRVVAIHAQDIFNGADTWLPLPPLDAITYYSLEGKPDVMGVDIGKVCFWSLQGRANGSEAYNPIKVTEARTAIALSQRNMDVGHLTIGPNAKNGQSSYAWLMEYPDFREPKPAPKLAILADPNDTELAEKLLAPKPKPAPLPASPNAKRMTTDVRYVITKDTFRRYPADDVMAEKAELIAADMWKLPNDGEPYTIRMNFYDIGELLESFSREDENYISQWEGYRREATELKRDRWLDFDMRGNELICATQVLRSQLPGNNIDKQWYIENQPVGPDAIREQGFDPASRQAWWEKGNWLNQRFIHVEDKVTNLIAEGLLDILVLALMDKSVMQERTPRPVLSSAFQPGGWLYSKELDVQEVTIRCPGFYHASNCERGEPTGRKVKMHRRRGHIRTYHRGLDNEFTGYIEPVWINAIAGVVPPPVVYTVRA